MTNPKKIKIEFSPGAFDNFEGTQEELDEMITEIQRMFESGDFENSSHPLTEKEFNELPDNIKMQLLDNSDGDTPSNTRTLQ